VAHHRFRTRFRRARPDGSDTPRKSFAGAVALVVVVGSLLLGPWMVFGRQPVLMIVGGVLAVAAIVGFLLVLHAKTDRWKE
jgi:fatty acid desaturase